MNIILSIDDQTLARARQIAERRGMSLDELILECLENLTASDTAWALAELERLWSEVEADSGGWKWNREEVHDRCERAIRAVALRNAGRRMDEPP